MLSGLGNFDNLNFTYTLSGANTSAAQTQTIAVTDGTSTLNIPAAFVTNTGATVFTITAAANPVGNCSVVANIIKNFAVNPLLDTTNLTIAIQNVCVNKPVTATIGGLTGATSVTISYDLSGANSATGQNATINLTNGSGSFVIPPGLLTATGDTILTVNAVVNSQNSCNSPVVNIFDAFSIFTLPEIPSASNAVYCQRENPTVADLLPNGSQYRWYDAIDATTPLSLTTPLTAGNYYVSQVNANNCESEKTVVAITLIELQPPTLSTDGQNFCGADNPTIQNLTANITTDNAVVWFDAPSGGNQLAASDLLEEGVTYYGFDFSESMNCTSSEALAVTVSLTVCNEDPEVYDFFIPDGFSPNGDNVNDTWRIPDIQFLSQIILMRFTIATAIFYSRETSTNRSGMEKIPNPTQ
ncbi:hypothetical protein [Flavobacterium sp. 3HN19-14]|uniref:Ig-like domain-containing protein n=1 Tax=Flavobacterium sp. 3HN19-14 TaxID=3448133 RepID=UPI003EE3082E